MADVQPPPQGLSEADLLGQRKFEAAEHEAIGNAVRLKSDRGKSPIRSTDLSLAAIKTYAGPRVDLFFGRIIALAGDYYTTWDAGNNVEPISSALNNNSPPKPYNVFQSDAATLDEQRKRFLSAVNSLLTDQDGYLYYVGQEFDEEEKGLEEVKTNPAYPHENDAQAYHKHTHNIPGDMDFAWATTIKGKKVYAKYGTIAWRNFDHFNIDAVAAYGTGHSLALDSALEAGKMTDASARREKLKEAYIREAFAAHYLTDLFSSGHCRAPRRKLHNPDWWDALFTRGQPINDDQCRFMHDDDSATGLLVANAAGNEWIAYGDKQFFSPQNLVNRWLSIEGVKAGVEELFHALEKGIVPKHEDYAALKLIPSPQLAYRDTTQIEQQYDSPAPLWILENSSSNSFSLRADNNDHSRFDNRRPADPRSSGLTTKGIEQASFRGDDQFPNTSACEAFTGGFVHVQDLPNTNSGRQDSLNVWGLIDVPDVKKLELRRKVFTLRNRTRNFDSISPASARVPLHWTNWANGSKTSLLRFDFDTAAKALTASSWPLMTGQLKGPSDQVAKAENLIASPLKPGSLDFDKVSVTNLPGLQSANLARVFVEPVLAGSTTDAPSVLAIGWVGSDNAQYKAAIGALATQAGCTSPSPKISWTDTDARPGSAIRGNFKLYRGGQETSSRIIHIPFGQQQGQVTVIDREWSFSSDASTVMANNPALNLDIAPVEQALVGDLLGKGSDQTVLVSGTWPNQKLTLLASPAAGAPWTQLASFDSATADHKYDVLNPNNDLNGCELNEHYITALVPRYGDIGDADTPPRKPGCKILQVSSVRKNGTHYLNFRTYLVDPADSKVFTGVRDSIVKNALVKDEFYGNPNYFSIAWLPTLSLIQKNQKLAPNSLLHVFSFYGVLGVRLFTPMKQSQFQQHDAQYTAYGPYVYQWTGQSAYQGTPSLGMGMGMTGQWNFGVMPWGDCGEWNKFVDVNVWNRKKKGYGISAEDEGREFVSGWEVERRPT